MKLSKVRTSILTKIAPALFLAVSALPAATLCVNPGGTQGCYATISAAVTAATAGSIIQVAQGIYKETVTITKTLSVVGSNGYSIIDATGLSYGIFVNGMSAPPASGLWGVTISGFTVKNAKFEGILVANSTEVTISGNTVEGNDLGLNYAAGTCPGQPAYETNEGFDCGEGIHLIAVDHSVVSGNIVTNNAGGILLSDETGMNYENVITGNSVTDNALDCGVTLASHAPAPNLPQGVDYGIYSNTVSHNLIAHNGYIGQGSGVGIYAAGPGAIAAANVVSDNILTDNGIGGVDIHNHAAPGVNGVPMGAPGVNLEDNKIIGNQISGNGADNDDPLSPGATGISILSFAPVTGTVISGNTFSSEIADIVFNGPGGLLAVHLNSFSGIETALALESGGGIDATQNWWGCPTGPGGIGCSTFTGSPIYAPIWLTVAPVAPPVQ